MKIKPGDRITVKGYTGEFFVRSIRPRPVFLVFAQRNNEVAGFEFPAYKIQSVNGNPTKNANHDRQNPPNDPPT